MTAPQRLADTPTQGQIERALSRLCTNALRTWWILERGQTLMGLDCVRAYLPSDPKETDYARALRRYLETATVRLNSRQHRIIVEVVLGLGDDRWKSKTWRNQVAKVRRAEAGRQFRGGDSNVSYGTIRQHHEPRAVQALAAIILSDETEVRREAFGEPAISDSG